MQHIGIHIEDEWREIIEETDLNMADILNLFGKGRDYEKDLVEYLWLTTINPYGDTTFNYLQVPILIRELERIKGDPNMQGFEGKVDEVIKFLAAERSKKEALYVKFTGD